MKSERGTQGDGGVGCRDGLSGVMAALRVQVNQLEKTIEYGGPSEICGAIDCVDSALQDVRRAAIPCLIDHAKVAKGLKCPGCGEVPNPLSDKIISAPTGEELQPTKEEQEHFERLVRWQEESARSPIRLGGKPLRWLGDVSAKEPNTNEVDKGT